MVGQELLHALVADTQQLTRICEGEAGVSEGGRGVTSRGGCGDRRLFRGAVLVRDPGEKVLHPDAEALAIPILDFDLQNHAERVRW